MNAYTTRGQARMQQRDLATILRTGTSSYMAAVSLAGLERQRGWQAEVEVEWQLMQNGVTPQAHTPVVALLRRQIGAALVRAGDRLAGVPRSAVSPEMTPATSMLSEAG
jgi:hypothetical protein